MNSKKMYFVMLGIIALLFVGLFAGTYGVNTLLQSKSKKLVDLKLQSQVVSSQQVGLNKAKKQIQQYSDLEKIAKTVVPQDKDQAEAVREIAKVASDSGISYLSSVTFPASTLGTPGAGAAAASGSSTSGSSSSSSSQTPTANKNNLTQLVPVVGIKGVYQLQITITQSSDNRIPYNQFLEFLSKLEQNRRTAQVISVSITPDTKTPNMVAFTLILNEFIKP